MVKTSGDAIFGMNEMASKTELANRVAGLSNRISAREPRDSHVLLPGTGFRFWWDAVSMTMIVFISLTLPYRLAFVVNGHQFYDVFDVFCDLFFIADIFLNFRTGPHMHML
jgi:hypothetical protein